MEWWQFRFILSLVITFIRYSRWVLPLNIRWASTAKSCNILQEYKISSHKLDKYTHLAVGDGSQYISVAPYPLMASHFTLGAPFGTTTEHGKPTRSVKKVKLLSLTMRPIGSTHLKLYYKKKKNPQGDPNKSSRRQVLNND